MSERILSRERKFDLNETISVVMNEESRWKLLLSVPEIDNDAFITKQKEHMKKATNSIEQPQTTQGKNQKSDLRDNLQ